MANNTEKVFTITVDYKTGLENLERVENSLKSLKNEARELAKNQKELDAQRKSENISLDEYNRKTDENKRKLGELKIATIQAKDAKRQANLELRNAAKAMDAAEGSLAQLQAQLNLAQHAWKHMGEEAQNSLEGKQVLDNITRLNTEVSAMEQKIGKFGRNVGNYASGFNALGFQVQQVARELPSLTNSAQQFFLAISNNLPMLADELKRAAAANKSLAAEGQKGVPVIKQLLSSIMSWQTALVVGITLMTAYGKEIGAFVKGLFSGKVAAKDFAVALRDIRNAMDFSSLGTDVANFQKLAKAWRDLGDNAKSREQFLKDYRVEIEKTGVAVNNVNDADNLFVDNTAAYLKSLYLRTRAQAGITLAAKQYEKAIEIEHKYADKRERLLNRLKILEETGRDDISINNQIQDVKNQITAIDDEIARYNQLGDTYIGVTEEMAKEARKALAEGGHVELTEEEKARRQEAKRLEEEAKRRFKEALEKRKEALAEIVKAEGDAAKEIVKIWQKDNAEGLKSVYENEKNSYSERLSALSAYVAQQKQLIEEAQNNQIDQEVRTTAEKLGLDPVKDRERIENMIRNTIIAIRAQTQVDIENLEASGAEERLAIFKNATTEELEAYRSLMESYGASREDMVAIDRAIGDKRAEEEAKTAKKIEDIRRKAAEDLAKIDSDGAIKADFINATIDDENKRKNRLIQNEIEIREEKMKSHLLRLEALKAEGEISDAEYQKTLSDLKEIQNQLTNLGKVGNAEGNDERSFFRKVLGIPAGEKGDKQTEEIKKELTGKAFDLASEVSGIIANAEKASIDRRLEREKKLIDDKANSEKKGAKARKDAGILTEEQYQKELERIDKKADEERLKAEKKAFEDKKKVDTKYAIIDTLLSVGKTFAKLGWPAGIVPAAIAAAEGAVRVAAIQSQKFKRGGVVKMGTTPGGAKLSMLKGPSHAQGGMRIYLEGSNVPIGEMEGDEILAVINKRSSREIQRLSHINQMGGGKKFAAGGVAYGGIPAPGDIPTASEFYDQLEQRHQKEMTAIRAENREYIDAISNRIDNIKVHVVEYDITKTQNDIKAIVKRASF